jgi:hypothetical protein
VINHAVSPSAEHVHDALAWRQLDGDVSKRATWIEPDDLYLSPAEDREVDLDSPDHRDLADCAFAD